MADDDRDPIIPAGTRPLPYVQVGMVLRPMSDAWRVLDIWSDNGMPRVRLRQVGGSGDLVLSSPYVRERWRLAEDFDPNGCAECGCTSVPCGCEP
jgi:hypothetical protein